MQHEGLYYGCYAGHTPLVVTITIIYEYYDLYYGTRPRYYDYTTGTRMMCI